jgi:hypothetical protein
LNEARICVVRRDFWVARHKLKPSYLRRTAQILSHDTKFLFRENTLVLRQNVSSNLPHFTSGESEQEAFLDGRMAPRRFIFCRIDP